MELSQIEGGRHSSIPLNSSPSDDEKNSYSSLLSKAFDEESVASMVEFFCKAPKEERRKMVEQAPIIAVKEQRWNEELKKWKEEFPNLEDKYDAKCEKHGRFIDRRTLLAEAIWEEQIEMLQEMAPDCMSDFQKSAIKFDRSKFEVSKNSNFQTLLSDFNSVKEKATKRFMSRLAFEYEMIAQTNFSAQDAKALTEQMLEKTQTPEERLKYFFKLKDEFTDIEKDFQERRSELLVTNPPAHELFMKRYSENIQHQTFEAREMVMEEAIEEIDELLEELAFARKEEVDPSEFSSIKDLMDAIKKEKQDGGIDKNETKSVKKENTSELTQTKDEIKEEAIKDDEVLSNAIIEREILDRKYTAVVRQERFGENYDYNDFQTREIRKVQEKGDREMLIDFSELKEDDEVLRDDILGDPLSVSTASTANFYEKDDVDKVRGARIIEDLQKIPMEHGMHLGVVVDEDGVKATAKEISDRRETIDSQIKNTLDRATANVKNDDNEKPKLTNKEIREEELRIALETIL